MSERVALIGLSGAGKTKVAPKVASRLGCDWIDLDKEIARAAGVDVPALIRRDGERSFRARESAALRTALEEDPRARLVVACGAGVILDPESRARLAARALTIWLRVSPKTAAARLTAGGKAPEAARPLLEGSDPESRLTALWEARRESYETAAAAVVDTDGRTPDEVADLVLARVREAGWA
ncbi:MAG TPA: shikimate kinase [Candidatus Eisenbacteria bacterium]|nr:shikimate kinase [Candidatus Eisenbacteria bacterium]